MQNNQWEIIETNSQRKVSFELKDNSTVQSLLWDLEAYRYMFE